MKEVALEQEGEIRVGLIFCNLQSQPLIGPEEPAAFSSGRMSPAGTGSKVSKKKSKDTDGEAVLVFTRRGLCTDTCGMNEENNYKCAKTNWQAVVHEHSSRATRTAC